VLKTYGGNEARRRKASKVVLLRFRANFQCWFR
jgi:hypothetical protein